MRLRDDVQAEFSIVKRFRIFFHEEEKNKDFFLVCWPRYHEIETNSATESIEAKVDKRQAIQQQVSQA